MKIALFLTSLTLAAAAPAVAEPLRMDSRNNPVVTISRLPDGGLALAVAQAGLDSPRGRARLAAALDQAAASACANLHPRRAAQACIAQTIEAATRGAGPEAARALRLARQDGASVLAARTSR